MKHEKTKGKVIVLQRLIFQVPHNAEDRKKKPFDREALWAEVLSSGLFDHGPHLSEIVIRDRIARNQDVTPRS